LANSEDDTAQDGRKSAKCFFTTAMKEFHLSKRQLDEAIELGVLTVEYVKNPYHRSTSSKLLYRNEIAKNLQLIADLSKLREKGLVYNLAAWGKLLNDFEVTIVPTTLQEAEKEWVDWWTSWKQKRMRVQARSDRVPDKELREGAIE